MTTIDEKVVEARFDNRQFAEGTKSTLSMLDRLKAGLRLDGASKGLQEVGKASSQLNMNPVIEGTQEASRGFSIMQIAGVSAIATIVNRAVNAGTQLAKSLTIGPLSSGLEEYATNMNSIQTILANTQASGAGLTEVNAALDELNHYSDQTIYNFSEMARNIGTFTAAGVDLETSTAAIKGIANLAAVSGSNSQQASTAMYQLSQALAAGKVSLMDWNSVVNAGMGGTVFQRALSQTAVKMGELDESSVKLTGKMKNVSIAGQSFRDSISAANGEPSWLSSEVLTKTLEQFTGDLTDAQLKAQGYTAQEIKDIQAMAKTAMHAATEVKTLSGVWDVAREAAGSGWAQTWRTIFGDFEEAKTTFTAMSNAVTGIINRNADARNKLLQSWKNMGGRKAMIQTVISAFHSLQWIVGQVTKAFRDVFPAATGVDLIRITVAVRDFIKAIRPSRETLDNIRRTFAGLFAILGIGWELLKAGAKFFFDLFSSATEGSSGILGITGNIGDFLVNLHKAIKDGDVFTKFFDRLADFIRPVIDFLQRVGRAIGSLFGANNEDASDNLASGMERLRDVTENVGTVAEQASAAWSGLLDWFGAVVDRMRPFIDFIGGFLRDAGAAIGDFLSGLTFGDILAGVATGGFVILVAKIKKLLGSITDWFNKEDDDGPGFLDNLKDSISQLTDTLKGMQNALNAAALISIAIAVGILALSIAGLSKIPPGDLFTAVGAVAALMAILVGTTKAMGKLGVKDAAKIFIVGAAFMFFAVAVNILASAAKKLADLSWSELTKGLIGVVVLVATLASSLRILGKKRKDLVTAGIGLLLFATAIRILAEAVEDIAALSWEEMTRGLIGVAALLTALGLFTRFSKVGKVGVGAGIGILAIAAGIWVLASALEKIARLDWGELVRGMTGLAVGMVLMFGALKLLPKKEIMAKGTAILLVAAAMWILADALEKMGSMSGGDIAKSLIVMAGAMAIMVIAIKRFEQTPAGAAALLISAAALWVLAQAMQALGSMDWGGVFKAIVAIGAVFAMIAGLLLLASTGIGMAAMIVLAASLIIIAGALLILSGAMIALGSMSWADIGAAIGGLALLFVVLAIGGVLSPLIVLLAAALVVLSVALVAIAGAIYLAGAGIKMFAEAMDMLSKIDAEGANNIVSVFQRLIMLIPLIGTALALMIANFIITLGNAAPDIAAAVGKILAAMGTVIRDDIPKLVDAFMEGITKSLQAIGDRMPEFVQAGVDIIVNFLQGIADGIGPIARAGANIVIEAFEAMGREIPRMAEAGADMVIEVLNGLADTIRTKGPEIRKAAGNLADAIIDGLVGGIGDGIGGVKDAVVGMGKSALGWLGDTLGISSPSKEFAKLGKWSVLGFVKGLKDAHSRGEIENVYQEMKDDLVSFLNDTKSKIDDIEKRREDLRKDKKTGSKEYKILGQQLAKLRKEYWNVADAKKFFVEQLDDENKRLKDTAAHYERNAKKLEEARQALADAKATRDDYATSIRDQYGDMEDITGETKLGDWISNLEKQIVETQKFTEKVQELRRRGLNDELYKELLAKGPEAMPFIDELLEGGDIKIDQLNTLTKTLDRDADILAIKSSSALYEAGVQAAAGLVKGLEDKEKNIQDLMNRIADNMVTQLKTRLGIKSPSKVFEEMGSYSGEGLVRGLDKMRGAVGQSAESVGQSAIDGMKKTISGLGAMLEADVDMTPVIAPVLDLSNVRKDASGLSALFDGQGLTIGASYSGAADAANGYMRNRTAAEEAAVPAESTHLEFTQINNSPKALSQAEIYRNTNNQISRAKGALTTYAK